jgi:hypothetical protein
MHDTEDLPAATRRVFAELREALDLPFVPTIFKQLAAQPEYLRTVWDDLAPVLRSKEFHAASKALTEQARLLALEGGWPFPDQIAMLASQNLSGPELALFSGISGTFVRAIPQTLLVARLLQRGYGGGQRGRVTDAAAPSAISQLLEFHVPPERSGGLRVWLIYTDIRRRTGAAVVPSVFRMLSPFPGYLAGIWMECKRLLEQPAAVRAVDDISNRSNALIAGLPVHDHRSAVKKIGPETWREIEDTVDTMARVLPQFSLTTTVWHRSFPAFARVASAA